MRYFIIAAEGLTKDAERKLIDLFREHKLGWWHHVRNVWLITSQNELVTTEYLRNKVAELRPSGNPLLVMEVSGVSAWNGMKPTNKPDMFAWLRKAWPKG